MDTLETIRARRAVKHYDPEHRMSEDEISELMDLALQSPTAFNIQHWRFVLVRDPALRKEIRANAWDQAQVTDASLLIVLTADTKAWEKDPKRYWVNAPVEVQISWCQPLGPITKTVNKPNATSVSVPWALRRKPSCWPRKPWVTIVAQWMDLISRPLVI